MPVPVARLISYFLPAAVVVPSSLVWLSLYNEPSAVCVRGSIDERFEKTIAALDSTVDLGLTLSVSLVGLGAALLVGLTSDLAPDVKLTRPMRALIFVAILLFAQSAMAGVWWRLGIASVWLNQCTNWITEPFLFGRYQADFIFFVAGLFALLILVLVSTYGRHQEATR